MNTTATNQSATASTVLIGLYAALFVVNGLIAAYVLTA